MAEPESKQMSRGVGTPTSRKFGEKWGTLWSFIPKGSTDYVLACCAAEGPLPSYLPDKLYQRMRSIS